MALLPVVCWCMALHRPPQQQVLTPPPLSMYLPTMTGPPLPTHPPTAVQVLGMDQVERMRVAAAARRKASQFSDQVGRGGV